MQETLSVSHRELESLYTSLHLGDFVGTLKPSAYAHQKPTSLSQFLLIGGYVSIPEILSVPHRELKSSLHSSVEEPAGNWACPIDNSKSAPLSSKETLQTSMFQAPKNKLTLVTKLTMTNVKTLACRRQMLKSFNICRCFNICRFNG